MTLRSQVVIGVPGQWAQRSDIVTAIATQSEGYLFAGAVLFAVQSKQGFMLEVQEHDPELAQAFSIAGRHSLNQATLDQIAAHTFTLYLVAEGGSVDIARAALHAANGLLKAGGLAVKVESTGIAHGTDKWNDLCENDTLGNLLNAYVMYVGGHGEFYSCGMHNLGHPDAEVQADISPNEAAQLLHTFVGYLLVECPRLHDGETFSIAADAPYYQLQHEPCTRFEPQTLFHNPHGVWKLIPV